jgi:hypothetical protein
MAGQALAVSGSQIGGVVRNGVGGPAGVIPGTGTEWPGGAGFRQATFAEVREFFGNPKAPRTNATNPFLVMQANLYVTQVRSFNLRVGYCYLRF